MPKCRDNRKRRLKRRQRHERRLAMLGAVQIVHVFFAGLDLGLCRLRPGNFVN